MNNRTENPNKNIRISDASKINLVNQYNQTVKTFKNNTVNIEGKEYLQLDKALETLKEVAPFSSMFT
ncbi:hypothetical protein [Clostridium senegalense]|uniref:Uncharacterized protein n=1 Tax=Clostridium senegalense TaxID=1465809 RepID=A0A6M0H5W1_9CLOT|nr:hypothetical protein [Clostridium senegalense]NEU06100.1 hypothetical protein [Clostridium senegalense]